MPNINAFQAVVHEKRIFKDLSKIAPLFTPDMTPQGASPLNLNPHSLEMLPTKFS